MTNRREFLIGTAAATAAAVTGAEFADAAPFTMDFTTKKGKMRITRVATGLDHPWSILFLPGGTALVTERPGRIRWITRTGALSAPLAGVPSVYAVENGGLFDLIRGPTFATDRLVYLSYAEPRSNGNGTTVARARLSEDLTALTDLRVIWRQWPTYIGSRNYGCRLAFDRLGRLFITSGDRFDLRDQAQNPKNNLGKIVRIMPDGRMPPDNPHKSGWHPSLWSIGHRNPQGAVIHPDTGQLWTVEHGPQGGDELNFPRAGRNYGWPVITYGAEYETGAPIGEGTSKPGMEQPVRYWVPSIAPSGLCFYSGRQIPGWRGNLFLGALVGQRIVRLTMSGNTVAGQEYLFPGLARIRDIRESPSGYLYFITDQDAPYGSMYRISLAPA